MKIPKPVRPKSQMINERPKCYPHMINDAGREMSKEEAARFFGEADKLKMEVNNMKANKERELVDDVMKIVVDRIFDRRTYDAIIYQLEESYDIKIDKNDLTPQLIQEEIVYSLYREHSHPHIKRPNQNDHIFNKVKHNE